MCPVLGQARSAAYSAGMITRSLVAKFASRLSLLGGTRLADPRGARDSEVASVGDRDAEVGVRPAEEVTRHRPLRTQGSDQAFVQLGAIWRATIAPAHPNTLAAPQNLRALGGGPLGVAGAYGPGALATGLQLPSLQLEWMRRRT